MTHVNRAFWKEGVPMVEKTCKCKETGGCKCGSHLASGDRVKPAKKRLSTPLSAMYKNDSNTSFSLSYVAAEIGKHFGHMFGAFTIADEGGALVVHTGMRRDSHLEDLIENAHRSRHSTVNHEGSACRQPCGGECESACSV